MKPVPWTHLERYRMIHPKRPAKYGDPYGAFEIPHKETGVVLHCIANSGEIAQKVMGDNHAWDHVSVSTTRKIPNWLQMTYIKSLFWEDTETVMQLHVPISNHVNIHPNCLHLWRPLLLDIPLPPVNLV
jgi:hypothetical protein